MVENLRELFNEVLKKKNICTKQFDSFEKANLRYDLGLDSLDLAELTVRIENEFGVDIFEDGIVETVGEILEKLNNK